MFEHNVKQSGQLMKSAIPLMAKLKIPPTPYNYGIWYQYASNKNPELNQVVDRAIRRFGGLPSFVSQDLFNDFLLPEEFQHGHKQGPALNQLTEDLEAEADVMSKELGDLNTVLNNAQRILKSTRDHSKLEKLVALLEINTFKANQAIEQFNRKLDDAQDDLTALKAELEDTRKISEQDPLTSLLNKTGFERALYSLVPYAEDDLTIMLIDIDDLSGVNDEYGKKVGTSLIRYLSKILLGLLPETGVIARLNGGRFAIAIKDMELSSAAEFAEQIRHQVSIQKIRYKNTKMLLRPVTVSIGLTTLLGDQSPEQLFQKAEHYLVYAKRTGRNRVSYQD